MAGALRNAERQIADIVMLLHYLAGQLVTEPATQHRLRALADDLDDVSKELRGVWESGFGELG